MTKNVFKIDSWKFQQVKEFKYLETIISNLGLYEKEIQNLLLIQTNVTIAFKIIRLQTLI